MAARKVHEVLNIQHLEFRQLPQWMEGFLERVENRPQAARPDAVFVSKKEGFSDSLVVLRLSDLLALVKAEE